MYSSQRVIMRSDGAFSQEAKLWGIGKYLVPYWLTQDL